MLEFLYVSNYIFLEFQGVWKPCDLVFSQEFDSIVEAGIVERKIKSWKRKDFIEKIVREGVIKSSGCGSVG